MNNEATRSNRRIARMLALGAALGSIGLPACNAASRSDSGAKSAPGIVWMPSVRPAFATVQGDTLYSLVPAEGRDLLVLEETGQRARGPQGQAGRLTWFVAIPADAPTGRPLDLGRDAADGWVLEQISGMPSHAAPLSGRVIIHERSEGSLTATFVLTASTAGATVPAAAQPLECNGRFSFVRADERSASRRELPIAN